MRTGPSFTERHTLADGTHVTLRHIAPDDGPELRRAFHELSPESRYRRFFHEVGELSDATIHALTHVDGQNQVAIVAVAESPDLKTERGLGIARFVRLDDEPDVAEAAITVIDPMQKKGLGHLLALVLGEAAHERGIKRFRAEVLPSNAPMRNMLHELGALVVRETPDSIVFDIPLDPPHDDRASAIGRWIRAAADRLSGYVRPLVP